MPDSEHARNRDAARHFSLTGAGQAAVNAAYQLMAGTLFSETATLSPNAFELPSNRYLNRQEVL
jgi:hypothetical protein